MKILGELHQFLSVYHDFPTRFLWKIAVFSAGLGNSPSRALCRDPRSGGTMGLRDRMQIRHLVWLFKYIQITRFFNGVIDKPGCWALVYIFSHPCGTWCYFVQCFHSSIDLLCHFTVVSCWKVLFELPSGEHTKSYGKSPFLMGTSTISMAIFNCYVSSPEGKKCKVLFWLEGLVEEYGKRLIQAGIIWGYGGKYR